MRSSAARTPTPESVASELSVSLSAGQRVLIVVDGYHTSHGNFLLEGELVRGDSESACCEPHRDGGCDEAVVQACVCEEDDYCCDIAWDEQCVAQVREFGCGMCP